MMASPLLTSPVVIASDIPYADFLWQFDGQHVEWTAGKVLQMPPVSEEHDDLTGFLYILIKTYLALTGGGRILRDPMVMRTHPDLPARQPDLQVLLPHHLNRLAKNSVEGAADVVIEVVSPESRERDYGDKFREYERGGVAEYWIIDSIRSEVAFYRHDGRAFTPISITLDGYFQSVVLPKLRFSIPILFQPLLPEPPEIVLMVQAMIAD